MSSSVFSADKENQGKLFIIGRNMVKISYP